MVFEGLPLTDYPLVLGDLGDIAILESQEEVTDAR